MSRTIKRVSRRRFAPVTSFVTSWKSFTKTVPAGKAHSPLVAKLICSSGVYGAPVLGTDSQRVFTAASDQSWTLGAYGMRPLTGVIEGVLLKTPVSESNNGNEPGSVGGTTLGIAKYAGDAGRLVKP